jgi:cytochrome P450
MTYPCPPGPKGHLLWGNFGPFRSDSLEFLSHCAREYGDIASFRLGHRRIVLVSHPDLIEQVLVNDNRNFIKHFAFKLLRPTMGNGLLMSEGDFWLRQRRLMQPAFGPRQLETYAGTMVEHTRRMLAGWNDGHVCDVHHEMMALTLAIVAQVLLDVDTSNDVNDVAGAVDLLMVDFNYRFKNPLSWPLWLPTPWNRRIRRAIHGLGEIIQGIIAQRRASNEDRGDLLSMLVHARDELDGKGMTDRQLRDEVMTMFLAGHETTANALTWTWYLLCQHPEIEERLHAEVDQVLGGRLPTAADMPRLPFTERVILESMRLYPPAFVIGREAIEPYTIGDYRLPRGATLLMSQWVVHRDGRWYDEPLRFNPDRWRGTGFQPVHGQDAHATEPAVADRLPKYAYFPFGGGPRGCIGNRFAMLEAVLIVATMAQQVRFKLAEGQKVQPWPAITLRPADGLKATVKRRAVRSPVA